MDEGHAIAEAREARAGELEGRRIPIDADDADVRRLEERLGVAPAA
jgi:hypothetical protein